MSGISDALGEWLMGNARERPRVFAVGFLAGAFFLWLGVFTLTSHRDFGIGRIDELEGEVDSQQLLLDDRQGDLDTAAQSLLDKDGVIATKDTKIAELSGSGQASMSALTQSGQRVEALATEKTELTGEIDDLRQRIATLLVTDQRRAHSASIFRPIRFAPWAFNVSATFSTVRWNRTKNRGSSSDPTSSTSSQASRMSTGRSTIGDASAGSCLSRPVSAQEFSFKSSPSALPCSKMSRTLSQSKRGRAARSRSSAC